MNCNVQGAANPMDWLAPRDTGHTARHKARRMPGGTVSDHAESTAALAARGTQVPRYVPRASHGRLEYVLDLC